ncbi:MAG: hypothetical protein PHO20_05745 [Candidatus Peribacteraceae bacterium]|nr:hypothetical protein [Candidatus Peribacteraceae bacterium]MDD5740238.1 hypothetical protein [Candidatus Peribacteraceae bacterium]
MTQNEETRTPEHLSGETPSALQDRQVAGIRGQAGARAREQVPPEVSAELENLAARIERAVRRATDNTIRNLRVKVTSTEVLLQGRTNIFYRKQQAQNAVFGLRDVSQRLRNDIEVT